MNTPLTKDMMIGYSLGTGRLFCSFSDLQKTMEAIMGEPIWTHELGSTERNREITDAFEAQALSILKAKKTTP